MPGDSTPAAAGNPFTFTLDPNLAQGTIQLDATPSPALLASLVSPNGVLPATDTVIAGGSLRVAPGKDITVGPARVGFSADVNAAIGVFTTAGTLRQALLKNADLVSQVADALTFAAPAGGELLLLRWGYDLEGTASGTVALSPAGSATLSVSAGHKGFFAIVQGAGPGAKARDTLVNLIRSWKLPSQVKGIDGLAPFTWVITEVDGSFGIEAKVKFGYDFSWLRDAGVVGLKGDIGIRLQTGLEASLGFRTSGKYAVALSRESEAAKIRMRLFKLRMNGWDFGFGATATAKQVVPLPERFNDLLASIVGTHHQQIVKLLGQVDDWSDPSKPLFGPLVNLASDEARRIIQRITGITDLNAEFNEVKGRIQRLFDKWNGLPQQTTQLIWSNLGIPAQVLTIARMAEQVGASTSDGLSALLKESLRNVAFLNSPAGQALTSFAARGLFSALNSVEALKEIRETARQVGEVLDGGVLQSLLTNLQNEINTRLDLKNLQKVVDEASLDSMDAWLRARVEDFLEEELAGAPGVAAVQKLRAGLAAIVARRNELYEQALKALKHQWDFRFSATYQSNAAESALLDVVFDFDASGSEAADGLSLALSGQFDELLGEDRPGVEIRDGLLAYGLHTESHVSLTLPYFSTTSTHVNDALAKLSPVKESGGELIYTLEATDLVTVRNDYASALAISLSVPGGAKGVRIHSQDAATYRYELKVSAPRLTEAQLDSDFGSYARAYFPTEFQSSSPGTFADWARQIADDSGEVGNSLVSLSVSLPPQSLLAWLKAPEDDEDPLYKRMSMRLQRSFRRLLLDSFFDDVTRYRDVAGDTPAKALLTFCSIPVCSDAVLANQGQAVQFRNETAPGKQIYWNYRDRGSANPFNVDLRAEVVSNPVTKANLLARLETARRKIASAGDPDRVLRFYEDNQAGGILGDAIRGRLLESLFTVESSVVEQARQAGIKMAEFRKHQFRDPRQARKDLARFGQKVTDDFNDNLQNFAVGNGLLPLGTLIYAEAVTALDDAAGAPAAAMLRVRVLKPGVTPQDLEPPQPEDVLRTEVVVHAG